ncbi:MAG TPA: amidohydrolase family protein [Kofleriaceae bacterium]|nr:amidohydrolase family protein [Kofleriaceae bacterium]
MSLLQAAACGQELETGELSQSAGGGDGSAGYLIRDASLVLTMDSTLGSGLLGAIEDADVLIVGDTIAAVGPHLAAPRGIAVVDGRGMIVMPGFIDTHDHYWQSLIRGCAADDDLIGWLNRCVFPLNGFPFSEEDAYAGVRLSTTGLINTGVTTGVDWSHNFNPDFRRGNLRALEDSGMRFSIALFGANLDGSDIAAAKAEFIDGNPLASIQAASHPAPGFLELHMASMVAVANSLGIKLHVHLLENIAQVADDPMTVMRNTGALDLGEDLLTAHDVHLTDADIAELALHGVAASHQPLSNMRLASGIMRYPDLHSAGLRIGLGLDGGTNDTPDTFNNMRAAVGLQRAKSFNPHETPTVDEVLFAATMGGAEVLNMEDQIGSLTPGKQADLIIIDPNQLNFAPQLRQVNQIVFNGQPQNVTWVFVAGRPLKRGGQLLGVNVRDLLADAQTAIDNIAPALVP